MEIHVDLFMARGTKLNITSVRIRNFDFTLALKIVPKRGKKAYNVKQYTNAFKMLVAFQTRRGAVLSPLLNST